MDYQTFSCDAGDDPVDAGKSIEERTEVELVAEGQVGEDRSGPLEHRPVGKPPTDGGRGSADLIARDGLSQRTEMAAEFVFLRAYPCAETVRIGAGPID